MAAALASTRFRDVLQPPQLQQEVAVEAYEPDETEQPQKEKTRSFKGDDGVSYVFRDGDWVPGEASSDDEEVPPEKPAAAEPKKKKRKKKQGWDAKTTKCWIYVTGLPPDVSTDELAEHFGKCGAIARVENAPKIKLYRDDAGALKGDASLCYANASSVDVACSFWMAGRCDSTCLFASRRPILGQRGTAPSTSPRSRR